MAKPTLYIMSGLPFSGKTFLSRKISEHMGCRRISYDELWHQKKRETGRSLTWEELSHIAREQIKEVLAAGQSIVYDTLNDTVKNREELRKLAKSIGAEAITVYTKAPQGVLEQRRKTARKSKERHDVEEQLIKEAHERFEPPISEENVIEFTPETDLSSWLEKLEGYTLT